MFLMKIDYCAIILPKETRMRQVFARLFGSLKAGLVTGVIIGTAAMLPVAAFATNGETGAVKVTVESQLKSETNKWSANNTAKPGDTLRYIISYQNLSNSEQRQVVIRDSLPAKMELVAGTTMLYNQGSPNGSKVESNNITGGGVVIGNYGPGANAYIIFEAKVPAADQLNCGNNEFRNVGIVRPENVGEHQAAATTAVKRDCAPAPAAPTAPPAAPPTVPVTGDKEELPASGAGSVVGLFVVASVVGSMGYHLFLRRKLSR
jgi:uncharacterized repeat protein (TIGR01451 family)